MQVLPLNEIIFPITLGCVFVSIYSRRRHDWKRRLYGRPNARICPSQFMRASRCKGIQSNDGNRYKRLPYVSL